MKMDDVKFPRVKVKLSGKDGNVFSIIGRMSGALKKAGHKEAADEFCNKAISAGSYDEVLQMCMGYVDVS